MRFARVACILVPALLAACAGPATSPDASAVPCVTDAACPVDRECGPSGCEPIPPGVRPHIRLASVLFREYLDDAEIDFRAAAYDLLIGRVNRYVDRMRAIHPGVRLFEYVNFPVHTFETPDSAATRWARAHGVDPEDFYLHYRYDTAVPTWEGVALHPGFPPGVVPGWNPGAPPGDPPAGAASRAQSRVPTPRDEFATIPPQSIANLAHPAFRRFLVDYIGDAIAGTLWTDAPTRAAPADGILCDNAIFYPSFSTSRLDRTDEFFGLPVDDAHPMAAGFEAFYRELTEGLARRFGRVVDVMPNFGHVLFLAHSSPLGASVQRITPWAWGEVWLMDHGIASPTRGPIRAITWESDYETAFAAVVRQTRRGARRVLGARDHPLGDGTGTARGREFLLASYYLVADDHTYLLYETVNSHGRDRPLERWQYNPLVDVDVGTPAPVPAGFVDFQGRAATPEHYVLWEGPDPARPDRTARVLAREYTRARILVRLLPSGSTVDSTSALVVHLDAPMRRVRPDASLAPAADSVVLRNDEGAILVRQRPLAVGVAPRAAPPRVHPLRRRRTP